MAAKKTKNAQRKAKSQKPTPKKPSKKGSSLSATLRKAAKSVASKVGLSSVGKKPAVKAKAAPAKLAAPLKAQKAPALAKKAPALPPPVKGKGERSPARPALALVKGKPAPAPDSGKPSGKKGKDLVVVVPAPKGMAVIAKDAKGKKGSSKSQDPLLRQKRCREPGCDHDFTLQGYCRLHYIKNWKRLKRKEAILSSGQLNNYVEELVSKYPDKYLEVIRQDLASEKDWSKVVTDLELDSADVDAASSEEELEAAPEGVRSSGGGGARADFDDEGDSF